MTSGGGMPASSRLQPTTCTARPGAPGGNRKPGPLAVVILALAAGFAFEACRPPRACHGGPAVGSAPEFPRPTVVSANAAGPARATTAIDATAATRVTRRPRPRRRGRAQPHHHDGRGTDHQPGQPSVVVRVTGEHTERRHRRGDHRDSQCRSRPAVLALLPAHHRTGTDQRGHRRRQRDRVVRVEDPGHEAEHQPGAQQPAAPHEHLRAPRIGAGSPPPPRQQDDDEQQCRRQQPTDLPGLRRLEHPADARHAPHRVGRGAGPMRRQRRGAARFVAGEPPEPVVTERQLHHRVVRRAADPWPLVGRPQPDQQDPPAGRDNRGADSNDALPQPLSQPRRAREQVGHRQCGRDQHDL